MSKELKFRYKDPKGFLFIIDLNDLPSIKQSEYDSWEYCGQYTGLKDKNGKEICEGDIVKYRNHRKNDTYQIFEIKYNKRYMAFDLYNVAECEFHDSRTSDNMCYEVIGNTHENPELMNG